MKIGLHGGNCCGIKVIYHLSTVPFMLASARKPLATMTSFGQGYSGATNDMIMSNKRGKCDFFNEAAPQETYEKRFKRFITFIKTHRKHHIIEVVLNNVQKLWIPIIENLGFQKVTSGTNSNTGSTISIYHLVY